jgi:hypothetical protein
MAGYLSRALSLLCAGMLSISCAVEPRHQVVLVARFSDNSSVDRMAQIVASRLHMEMTVSGRGLFSPEWAHGIQLNDNRISIFIVPTAVNECSATAVYDGRSYSLGISTPDEDGAQEVAEAEIQLRRAAASVGGVVRRELACH